MKRFFNSAQSIPLATFRITIIAALAAGFFGCVFVSIGDYNAIAGKGEPENYDFMVGQYNRIKIDGQCEIRYYSAGNFVGDTALSDTVTLTVQPNLREYYKVEVKNSELTISTTRRVAFGTNKGAVLTVFAPALNHVTISGTGAFTTHDKITSESFTFILEGAGEGKAELDVKNLFIEVSGAGDFKLSGKADTANFSLNGAGDLNALALQTRDATVDMSGAGTVSVYTTGNLQINANGVGTVEYKGSPSLKLNKDGIVSIRRLN